MINTCPDHNSYRFALDIKRLPAKATDRFSRLILILALLFGFLLCLLGLYNFSSSALGGIAEIEQNLPQTKIAIHSFISQDVFSLLIFVVGLGVIVSALYFMGQSKTIFFDGSYFVVHNNSILAPSYEFTEPLYNYIGVRLRIKFYQFGILNKNKFIIELYHKDPSKIVPLYITTNPNNVREIWKTYAQALRMPGITISEKGMVSRNFKDLSRSYREVVNEWHLPKDFLYKLEKPSYISLKSRQSGEKMIKVHKLFLDAYSYLSAAAAVIAGALLVYAGINYNVISEHMAHGAVIVFYALLLSIVIYSFLNLAAKDIIIITRDKIFVFRKILFLRIRDGIMDIKNIKGIDINYTPTLDRYGLSIISDKQTLIVGSRLPVEDLRWIRAVLINEIIGN